MVGDFPKGKTNALESMLRIHKERIQSNVIQMAYVILGLGNLIIDEEFLRPENQTDAIVAPTNEKDRKQKFLLSQLNQFKNVYSDKLYRLIKKLLYRDQYYDVPSFLDLHKEYLVNEPRDKLQRESRNDFQINDTGYKLSSLYGTQTRAQVSHERTHSDNTYKANTSSSRNNGGNYMKDQIYDEYADKKGYNILQTTIKSNLNNTTTIQTSARQDGRTTVLSNVGTQNSLNDR